MLKSWNRLKAEKAIGEERPIGFQLGDPEDFSDYIMFGGGITGEIVVNSKQQSRIVMDGDTEYLTGARLYFDARRIAQDGLLLRNGCHLKVKDSLPLFPYLIWVATWENVGLTSQISTPKIFSEQADRNSKRFFSKNSKSLTNKPETQKVHKRRIFMGYLMQFAIILAVSLAGELFHLLIPLPIPAAVYGLLLLLAALLTGLVKPRHIKEASGWLIAIMPILFVAPAVNLTSYWDLIAPNLLPIVAIVVASTVLTFAVSGKVTDLFGRKGGNRHG